MDHEGQNSLRMQPTNCVLSPDYNNSSSASSSCDSSVSLRVLKATAATTTTTKLELENHQVNAEREIICADEDEDDNQDQDDENAQDADDEVPNLHESARMNEHRREFTAAAAIEQQTSQQQQQQHWQSRQKEFHRDLDDVKQVELFGVRIVALTINGKDRLCLAQISNTLLKEFSYNEIHNRRVALGITCIQCTPIQLEMLRRAGAMPSSSRRCGMITMREAERLCRSFLVEEQPPELPENFYFTVSHRVNYGCRGRFVPARYISSRAKCIECFYCGDFYSPNKFIFHSHRQADNTDCNPPDSPNINSWRKHIDLDWTQDQSQEIRYAWEDVKSLFNGGTRRRAQPPPPSQQQQQQQQQQTPASGTHQQSGSASSTAVKSSSMGQQRKSAASSMPNKLSHRFNSAAETVATPTTPNNDNDEQDHIDVVCGDQTIPIMLTEQHQRQPRVGRFNNSDELGNKPRTTAMHQQQQPQRGISSFANTNRRSLSSLGCGGSSMHQPLSKRNNLYRHHNHQSSILGDSQVGSGTKNPADLHETCRTSSFNMPTTVSQSLGATQLSSVGNQFNGIDFSNSAAVSGRPTGPPGASRLDKSINLSGQYTGNTSSSSNPLLIAPDTNFIHSQLYSQLMQPQQQLQLQTIPEPIDAREALRHHLWTSLLANLQCNFATSQHQLYSQMAQQQQQQQQQRALGAAASAVRISDMSSANSAQPSIDHLLASYPQMGTAKLISNPQGEINLNNYTTSQ